jgi:hypothetical protein
MDDDPVPYEGRNLRRLLVVGEDVLMVELVRRNDPQEICSFLLYDDLGEDSLQDLEEANALITPLMNYIREWKS